MTDPQQATAEWRDPRPGPDTVRIWLLGGFRVSVGSRSIGEGEWRLRKAGSLLKLLALAPGHRLHREQAMELLWPGLDSQAAANNLHHALHVARRILEPVVASAASRYLHLRDERLALCPGGPLWVDRRVVDRDDGLRCRLSDEDRGSDDGGSIQGTISRLYAENRSSLPTPDKEGRH